MREMKMSPFLLPHHLSFPDLPFLALISSFPPILFLFSSSSPRLPSFLHLSCIFNMYSSVNTSVMSQNSKLPHLPPPSFPLHYLTTSHLRACFSSSLHCLPLCPPSPCEVFPFLSRLLSSSTLTSLLPWLFG